MLKIIEEPNQEISLFMYIPNILSNNKIKEIHSWLKNKTFLSGQTSWNKSIYREQLWFQKDNKYFCNEWSKRYPRWESNPYESVLLNLQNDLQYRLSNLNLNYKSVQQPIINSCLINKYRDENDSIKPHRDTEITFGTNPTIIGLSIGSERKIKIKRLIYDAENTGVILYDNKKSHLNFDVSLENGSLFIMAGASQKYFSHEIPKEDYLCSERFSLTFREVVK
uniref:Fe2OG dioxygenase domain-containing protein n=1 Tax=viral metagenome TaxID=1070528 RepID=A0A6C0EKY1_9ZZZZ